MVDRVVQIADACVRHLRKLANNNGTPAQKDAVCCPAATPAVVKDVCFMSALPAGLLLSMPPRIPSLLTAMVRPERHAVVPQCKLTCHSMLYAK